MIDDEPHYRGDFSRRDTMELWRSVRGEQSHRPESEQLFDACKKFKAEPVPSFEVLSAQLQSLTAAYRKLLSRDADGSERVLPGRATPLRVVTGPTAKTTEMRRTKRTATSRPLNTTAPARSRLLATTASRAAAEKKTLRRKPPPVATPRSPPPPPETDVPRDDKAPKRALNPFPQLSPFMPSHRAPRQASPLPKTTTTVQTAVHPTPTRSATYNNATLSSKAKKSEKTVAATTTTAPAAHRPDTSQQASSYQRQPPATVFRAKQPGNPFQEILAKGISPNSPLPPPPPRQASRLR